MKEKGKGTRVWEKSPYSRKGYACSIGNMLLTILLLKIKENNKREERKLEKVREHQQSLEVVFGKKM